ncbi:wax ester/triacylglycerol synthase domain-containing protein [Mycolicibacterium phlei]
MGRLAAVDAQTYWMAATIPSDQFLLYAFAGPVPDVPAVVRALRERARRCPDFRLRIQDCGPGYPRWVHGDVAAQQTVVHPAPGRWADLLDAVARLVDDQLDPRAMAWRLHVFPGVEDIPGGGDGVVAVLQVAHALADGVRSSALAAWLFGRDTPVAPVAPPRPLEPLALPLRAYRAARTHRQLVRDTTTGLVAPPPDSCPVLSCNNRPEGRRRIRTVVRPRVRIPGPTVTVGVLAAVADALAGYLRERGEDPSRLGAEVPMAKAGQRRARNHFGNVGVGLYPALPFAERAARIADELAMRRRRAAHPAMAAADRAFAAMPGPLLRWGVAQFDPTLRSPTVTGNTVLSSVNRGPADLRFGSAAAVLTAGFPALSPMMGLTHGVHGIGDTVTISIYAAESAVADIDSYAARLAAALDP